MPSSPSQTDDIDEPRSMFCTSKLQFLNVMGICGMKTSPLRCRPSHMLPLRSQSMLHTFDVFRFTPKMFTS